MTSKTRLTLDLKNSESYDNLILHRGDSKSRVIEIEITDNHAPVTLTSDMSATINASTNGIVVADGEKATVDTANNIISFTVTDNMTSLPGQSKISLTVTEGDTVITAQTFRAIVTDSVINEGSKFEPTGGTVKQFMDEVAAARGDSKTLKEALATKANKETTYTKTKVDTKLSGKLDNTAGSVKRENIEVNAVGTDEIDSGAVNTINIADGGVTTDKLANNCITFDKLAEDVTNQFSELKGDLSKIDDKTIFISEVAYSPDSVHDYSTTDDVLGTNQYCAVIAPNTIDSYFVKKAIVKATKGKLITFAIFSKSKFYPQSSDPRIKFTKEYDVTSVVADENDEAKVEFNVPLLVKSGFALVAISADGAIKYGTYKDALYTIFNYHENWSSIKNGDSSGVPWNYEKGSHSSCYSLSYILESDCKVIKSDIKTEENLRKNVCQYDYMIKEDSTNAVQNKVLYNEFNIVEKEIIEPEEISYLNGNKNTVSFQNRSAVRILIPETEPFTVQRIDVNCKTGVDVYFGLWTFRRYVNAPSDSNFNRGYFTLQRTLGVVTSVENHAVLELSDLEFDQNTYHILACTKENALGLLSNDVISPKESWSIYNDFSLANTEVGNECPTLFYFTPIYSGETSTGYSPSYSVTYQRKDSIEVVTITNVKEKVKELMHKDIGGQTPAAQGGNVLAGKKWAACGDSVTMGVEEVKDDEGNYRTYEYFIAKRNGMVLYKDGISGSTMTSGIVGKENIAFSLDRYKDIPKDCDYITIWFGINDNTMSAPLGDISSTDKNTFYGAWNVVMKYIITNIPKAKIGLVVTHMGGAQYHQAVRDIAKKYGVSVFDIPQDPKIPLWCPATSYFSGTIDSEISSLRNSQWWVNPSHPSIEGYEYISYPFENWMRSL